LLIVDSQMPQMDGFTLVEQLRLEPGFASTSVMMLTSGGKRGDAQRCHKIGIAAYLAKPVAEADLLEAVLRVLGSGCEKDVPRPLVTNHTIREARKPLRILVAEDNAVNSRLAVTLLKKQGHNPLPVSNGREALAALEQERFDLVLMDVQMPEMDGLVTTRAIRTRESGTATHVPIIAMTAHAMDSDRDRCLAAGMDGYLSKPISPKQLLEGIEKVCLDGPALVGPIGLLPVPSADGCLSATELA